MRETRRKKRKKSDELLLVGRISHGTDRGMLMLTAEAFYIVFVAADFSLFHFCCCCCCTVAWCLLPVERNTLACITRCTAAACNMQVHLCSSHQCNKLGAAATAMAYACARATNNTNLVTIKRRTRTFPMCKQMESKYCF